MRAYFTVTDLVPPSATPLGDLRTPLLTLPLFMTPEWVSKNISFSPHAQWSLALHAAEITAETGAPFDKIVDSNSVTPDDILSMLRYPLFLRSFAARASAADPAHMASLFSIVKSPVRRFLEALTSNADLALTDKSVVDLASSIFENGTPEQVEAAVQMFALCAMLVPFAGIQKLIKDHRSSFGDVATFIEDVDLWIAAAGRATTDLETPSWVLFRDYHSLVPPAKLSGEFHLPIPGASEAALRLGIPSWIGTDAATLKLVSAAAPGVAHDIGMAAPSGLSSDAKVIEFVQKGLAYPLFLASLSTRMSLLDPVRLPVWTRVFGHKAALAERIATDAPSTGGGVSSVLIDVFSSLADEERQAALDWLIVVALTSPSDKVVGFIRANEEIRAAMGAELLEIVDHRYRSLDIPYAGPDFPTITELTAEPDNIATHFGRTFN
ncbi:hypothetical protein HFN89_05600 [Rhizobium laguerreae]|nr:hypothetical protein [Rhizobium laguerreae]